jgi:hypothetical protein
MIAVKRLSPVLVSVAVICLLGAVIESRSQAPASQTLDGPGKAALQKIIDTAHHPDLAWPDFPPYEIEVKEFYTRTGGTLGWVQNRKPTSQPLQMIALFIES